MQAGLVSTTRTWQKQISLMGFFRGEFFCLAFGIKALMWLCDSGFLD